MDVRRLRTALVALVMALCVAAAVLAGSAGSAGASLSPGQLHKAYGLPLTSPVPQTIAVVVAYDAPTAAADLRTFTRSFGIRTCSASSGCFRKVNQRGAGAPLPGPDPTGGNWVAEAALGVQTARGVCQNCRILLVEADSDSRADFSLAVETAVRLRADEIVTAFVGSDDGSSRGAYDHPGVAIIAATGEDGFFEGAMFPAALPGVVAVGGTRLSLGSGGSYVRETVWNDGPGQVTSSGCSSFSSAPSWQVAEARSVGCGAQRSIADVSAAASPGADIYTSTTVVGLRGWIEAGGTSFASPLIAAVFALAGGVPPGTAAPALLYANRRAHTGGLRDVTSGSNGSCATAICRARAGYDGPTGLGTPFGLRGFRGRTLDPGNPGVRADVPRQGVRFDSRGRSRLTVRNDNNFAVKVSLRLRTLARVRLHSGSSGYRRVDLFSSASALRIPGAGRRVIALRLAPSRLALLKRLRVVRVTATITARDSGGRRAAVARRLLLRAPLASGRRR